jgi:hypothetical protein
MGKTPANYRTTYESRWHTFRIEVIDLKQIPAERFLQSEIPEAVIFAILCASESSGDFGGLSGGDITPIRGTDP